MKILAAFLLCFAILSSSVRGSLISEKLALGQAVYLVEIGEADLELYEEDMSPSFAEIARIAKEGIEKLQDEAYVRHLRAQITINTTDCDGAAGDIFAEWPYTSMFLQSFYVTPEFLRELLCDGRNDTINVFLDLLRDLYFGPEIEEDDKDFFFTEILKVLLEQTKVNPLVYVSHGTDHSVKTMNFASSLVQIPQVQNGMNALYECTPKQAQFIAMLNSLLHDIGYVDLGEHDVPKWLHSTSSALMTEILLANLTHYIGSDIVNNACNNTQKTMYHDFIHAIGTHNYDDGLCLWTNDNPNWSKCTFKTSGNPNDPLSKTTPLLNREEPYTRGYVKANALTSPLSFMVRVSDNLHAVRTRLTPAQRDTNLYDFLFRVYTDSLLREAMIQNQNVKNVTQDAKQRALAFVPEFQEELNNPKNPYREDLLEIISKVNAESVLHFYSNWIIEQIAFDPNTFTVDVTFYENSGDSLEFLAHPGVGLYQINRLASSLLSCYLEPDISFIHSLSIRTNIAVPGLSETQHWLAAFSKKPTYNATGIVTKDGKSVLVCEPWCAKTAFLTNSPERCLGPDNAVSACNYTAFGLIPPFTDLNYNPDLVPPSPDEPIDGPKKKFQWYYVGAPAIILVVIAASIFLVLYMRKRKQRVNYETIKD